MATTRIDDRTHATLQMLSSETGDSMVEILAKAVESFRRAYILAATNEAYAALQNDPEAWAEELAERALWDVTLSDGLEKAPDESR